MGCGGIPTLCNGVSEFGVSDSPCNTSTKNECGVNLHYVKVGLSRRVREGPSVVLGGIFFAQSGYPTGPGASESK